MLAMITCLYITSDGDYDTNVTVTAGINTKHILDKLNTITRSHYIFVLVANDYKLNAYIKSTTHTHSIQYVAGKSEKRKKLTTDNKL